MRLTVSDIPAEGIEEELRLPLRIKDIKLEDDVWVFLKIYRLGNKVLGEARIKSAASLVCSRCLRNFSYTVKADFDINAVPFGEFQEEREYKLSNEDLDIGFYQNDEIHIDDLVKEHLLLAFPMKPLCKSDCRGICPECGANLNGNLCGCGNKEIDDRLAPLQKINEALKRKKEEKF